jgi:transposase
MGGKHVRKTGTDRVASGGCPRGPAGRISEARERGSADSPACPVAAAGGLEHGRGSQGGGRPLPHGATVGGLVPAGRDCRSMRPSWGWTWAEPAWLTPEQEAAVAEEAAKGTFTTAADVRRWVADQFGVTYRPKGIYGLLRRVGCRPKVPRPIHVKADLEAQEDWKKGAAAQPCGWPE